MRSSQYIDQVDADVEYTENSVQQMKQTPVYCHSVNILNVYSGLKTSLEL